MNIQTRFLMVPALATIGTVEGRSFGSSDSQNFSVYTTAMLLLQSFVNPTAQGLEQKHDLQESCR